MGSRLLTIFFFFQLSLLSCNKDPKTVASCGDGIIDPAEECDITLGDYSCEALGHYRIDGVLGCKADCTFDRSDCGGICGDSVVDLGDGEECDSASLNGYLCETLGFAGGMLACGDDCRFDTAGCQNSCGNGLRETGETCDDGNSEDNDGCTALCVPEAGWSCDEESPTVCTPICGDGQVVGLEPCDGEDLGQKTCTSLTPPYYGGTLACNDDCTLDLTNCETAGFCGDGAVQAAGLESCDGDDLDEATCTGLGYYGGTLACNDDCTFLLTDCQGVGRCGDNTLQAAFGEVCDGTATGVSSCLSLGYYGGTIACDASCEYDLASCAAAGRCGDGILQSAASEICDTTNFGAATCTSLSGLAYGTLACDGTCRNVGTAGCYGKRYLAAGGSFASFCAIDVSSKAWCWGHGALGTLGNGTSAASTIPSLTSGNYNFIQIPSGGDGHFCGLISGGTIRCWGRNDSGQIGDNSTINRNVPTLASSAYAFTQVASGYYHNCALTTSNNILCWGGNGDGQLGTANNTDYRVPTSINGFYTYSAVAAGGTHTCALDTAGKAWCWGYNGFGQLGNNSTTSATSRVAVNGTLVFSKIYAGGGVSCGITTGGATYCWGQGTYGQLGRGSTTNSSIPVLVSGSHAFERLALYGAHVCGITTAGALYCWGYNNVGQVGVGNLLNQTTPQRITSSLTYTNVGVGAYATCAVESAGGLWCWGENSNSQLGNGTTTDATTPVLTSTP
ncbi:hypothetical protein KKD52_08940 [Myxococcota bacterium]|nr:hypothetical protein [Myxococcota bacterium]MBU1412474.1 hypothetical protein [Myxococcota bacterium]MBU1510472.1 hypothetical protein [Myxococcota bacterium]